MNIISERNYCLWPSYHVIYEWEDIFAQNGFNLVVCKNGLPDRTVRRIRNYIKEKLGGTFRYNGRTYNFRWILDAKVYRRYTGLNTIPIFLDFPVHMVEEINRVTKELPFYWVTCHDIYLKLKECGSKNVLFIPLSISDKYFTGIVPEKKIDVIQFGRKNSKLHEYMMEYCRRNPETEYVYQTENGSLTYESTIRGNVGKFDTRKEYFQMISSCRVSLVSSPGMDNSRDFGGIDFITPRFYESAANYCYMIGRYADNQEAKSIGIDRVCPNVSSYEEFERLMGSYLNSEGFTQKEAFDQFLRENVTSARIKSMAEEMKKMAK